MVDLYGIKKNRRELYKRMMKLNQGEIEDLAVDMHVKNEHFNSNEDLYFIIIDNKTTLRALNILKKREKESTEND